MKTIFYILIALCMTASFTSCTADSITDNSEITPEEVATTGGHGQSDPDGDEGGN